MQSGKRPFYPSILEVPDHWKNELFIKPASSVSPPPLPNAPSPPAEGDTESPRDVSARVLIAEDDTVSRRVLATHLLNWGYEPVITHDGNEAMQVMRGNDAPSMAILDWMMPGMDGVEVCRRIREINQQAYIIMLTALREKENIAEALKSGADDYVSKPWEPVELAARVQVGFRIVGLQRALGQRVNELEQAVEKLRALKVPEVSL